MRTKKKSSNNKLSASKSGSSDGALLVASLQINDNSLILEGKAQKTTYQSAAADIYQVSSLSIDVATEATRLKFIDNWIKSSQSGSPFHFDLEIMTNWCNSCQLMDLLYSQSKRTKWKLQVVCCLSGSSVQCKLSAPKLPPKKGRHNLKDIINSYGHSHPEEVFYFRAEEFIVSQFEAPSNGTDFESIKFNVRNKPTMLVLANPPRTNSKEKHPKNLLLIPSAIVACAIMFACCKEDDKDLPLSMWIQWLAIMEKHGKTNNVLHAPPELNKEW